MRLRQLGLHCTLLVTAMATSLAAVACTQETTRPDGGHGMLQEGSAVPSLSRQAHDGSMVTLDQLDQIAVIYFYPKDGTPGCTAEACAFRDAWQRYQDAGVAVIGVSADSADNHRSFAAQHDLPFPLISDADGEWTRAFGVPTYGPSVTKRVSFLVHDGSVARIYPGVDPGVHAVEVLEDAAAVRAAANTSPR